MFQHRHYVAIAGMVNKSRDKMTAKDFEAYVAEWADMLRNTNPNYDRTRFISACFAKPVNGRDKIAA